MLYLRAVAPNARLPMIRARRHLAILALVELDRSASPPRPSVGLDSNVAKITASRRFKGYAALLAAFAPRPRATPHRAHDGACRAEHSALMRRGDTRGLSRAYQPDTAECISLIQS